MTAQPSGISGDLAHFPRSTFGGDPECVECGGVWPCEGGDDAA